MKFIKIILKPYKEIILLNEIINNLEKFLEENFEYATYIDGKIAYNNTLQYLKKQIEYKNNKIR